jgi:hypothetical protein
MASSTWRFVGEMMLDPIGPSEILLVAEGHEWEVAHVAICRSHRTRR